MADQPVIPPVSNSTPLPKRRTENTGKGKQKPASNNRSSQKRPKDDGRPHVDEYA